MTELALAVFASETGTHLLRPYRLEINFVERTVRLERVA